MVEPQNKKFFNKNSEIYLGDCIDVLKGLNSESIDLIVTSPPYADQRKNTYGGVHPDKYVEWFLPKTAEFKRVLKSTGSFVLNIKEKAVNGERHTYVLELIIAMRKQGWLWTEEYIWHKKNCYPGKWTNRFRDSWERLLHFTKQKRFKMFQDSVKVPIGSWSKQRLKKLSYKDTIRNISSVGSGFGKNISNWLNKDLVYPTNVLSLATECANKNHSAAFPESLPAWFIELFTEKNDTVLDPFAGSGTTLIAANKLGRKSIGIDSNQEYFDLISQKLRDYDNNK
ncbi:MAG: site-specific DNA-methyltransferase [Elusimicrobiota bacterium]|nr:site-specific DNA-methyltransferase [Elusimicrobiota bacterium]